MFSSFRRRHSARRISPWILSVPLWTKRVYARNSVVHMVHGGWMDVHVLKALAYICYLATLLPESSSVDDNIKKGIETYFISFAL